MSPTKPFYWAPNKILGFLNFIFLSIGVFSYKISWKHCSDIGDFPLFLLGNGERKKTHKSLIQSWWLSAWGKTFGGMHTIQTEVSPGYFNLSSGQLPGTQPARQLIRCLFAFSWTSHTGTSLWVGRHPPSNGAECPSYPQRQGHSKHFVFYTPSPASVRKYTFICSHPYFSCHMC